MTSVCPAEPAGHTNYGHFKVNLTLTAAADSLDVQIQSASLRAGREQED